MAEDLHLHRPSEDASLDQNFLRPRFEDASLEAAWRVERLDTFRRVNSRGLYVLIVMMVAFTIMDMIYVHSGIEVVLTRTGF
ncbi:MAG: hypothetical protein QGG40_05790, partial [Myxococcota bacterium]|nr:hypothetical protein [Myxococcota bacterium]